MYIIDTCKSIWVYAGFCYANDCHQVAPRGKHNQAKTTESAFLSQTGEVIKHLDQVKLVADSGATTGQESSCLLENTSEDL